MKQPTFKDKFLSYFSQNWQFAVLIFFGILFSAGYLRTIDKWWYEDDPLQYAKVLVTSSPVKIFDPQYLRTWSTGKAFVPFQILSYWMDISFFGISPTMAYYHSLVSLIATLVIFYLVLEKLTHNKFASLLITLVWLLLPSTLAVHQFLATRHYMEGLFFGLAAFYLTLLFPRQKSLFRKAISLTFIGLFTFAAMLCKEIYATTIPFFIFIYGLIKKEHLVSLLMVPIMMIYIIYRIETIGPGLDFTMPFLNLNDYFKFLSVLPYTFSANYGGFLFYLAILSLTIILVWQKKERILIATVIFLLLFAGSLAAIYPVSYAVLSSFKIPGTWYRAPFLINTVMLFFGSYIVVTYLPGKYQIISLFAVLLIVLPGTHLTRQLWDERMTRAELEGKFYLDNPDKLLFSEEDAYWFIPGLKSLYNVSHEHHINKQFITGDHARLMINNFPMIWRYADGKFVADGVLYQEIMEMNHP